MGIHAAADVEEQQYADNIAPLGPGAQVKPTMVCRGTDRAVEVKFFSRPFARPAAQPSQRHLDRPGAKFNSVVEVAKLAPVPDLDGPAPARLGLAYPHAFGSVAPGTERRGSGRADPFGPPLVAALLLGQPLPQRLHELVEPVESRDLCSLFCCQEPLDHLCEPVGGQAKRFKHRCGRHRVETAEAFRKGAVEPVDVAFILHHREAGEVVEPFGVVGHETRAHPLQKPEILSQGDRNPRLAQCLEEREEHRR